MLLLFWKVVGVEVGVIRNIRWYHDESYSPRYLCGADQGLTILNPYISIDLPECSYFQTPAEVKGSCVFENYILAGTPSGVYQISWDTVKQYNCDVYSPQDLSSQSSLSYTTASGLLSDDIIALDALGPYLAIVTSSGLYWKKSGTGTYLNCPTIDGRDIYISAGPTIYFAESNQLRIKYGEPTDLSSWDRTISYPNQQINRISINTWNGQDVLFIATTSGLDIWQGDTLQTYYDVISGTKSLSSVVSELDSRLGWGHVFVSASGGVNILNLKSGLVEKYMDFNGIEIPAIGYPRLYSK